MGNIGLIFTIGSLIFNGIMFAIIKFNDLKHLSADVKEIKTDVKIHTERIAHIEGRLDK